MSERLQVLSRAAGWLAEPSGESRGSTKELIERLVRELKLARADYDKLLDAAKNAYDALWDKKPIETELDVIRRAIAILFSVLPTPLRTPPIPELAIPLARTESTVPSAPVPPPQDAGPAGSAPKDVP
jgi:hypothetical protein